MKRIIVTLESKSGKTFTDSIRTSGSALIAAKAVARANESKLIKWELTQTN